MSDDVLRNKVQDLLEKMERVFHTEWRKTKLNLDHEMIEHFIDPKGTFFEPDGPNTIIPWTSRDELLISYKSLLEEFGGTVEGAGIVSEEVADKNYADVISAADHEAEEEDEKEQQTHAPSRDTQSVPKPVKEDIPAPITSSHAIPKPQTGTQAIPGPGNVQWPGPMTAPVSIGPAAGGPGFPNPFAAAVNKKEPKPPAAMQGPETGKPKVKQDPSAIRAIAAQKKFAHLLKDVKQEVIRDFILAEGTNSGTGKPTVIIYTLENIWLEFAFPFEEGQRILNKYPQRDPELIEFMKSAGHNE
ncbi:hypothetical protein [Rubritalea tangerina]|uniref:Uncharacterized protein n=1 Tax=Rubritalea tangerina TaxID=430798 RepID=A0ABW4Z6Q5_9BACT